MIDRLSGEIVDRSPLALTVMIGGVGLHVFVPRTVLENIKGSHIDLFTHLVVREDSLTLYGFTSKEEREIFETLIKVSGVGPKIGIAILSTLSVDQLRNAVVRETPDVLTRVPGVGKKLAQKLGLELKDKIGWKLGLDAAPMMVSDVDADVVATLTALGYSIVEAQSAVQAIPRDAPQDVEERVRLALQYFM